MEYETVFTHYRLTKDNLAAFKDLIDTIRSTDKKMGHYELYNENTNCYCALGVYASEKLKLDLGDKDNDVRPSNRSIFHRLSNILSNNLIDEIWWVNDLVTEDPLVLQFNNFIELADVLETVYKKLKKEVKG